MTSPSLSISQVSTADQIEDVRDLLREYTAWVVTIDPGTDDAPTFQGLEEELAGLPGIYSPPKGRLLMAVMDGLPAGCVALKPNDGTTVELKRLYVRPAFSWPRSRLTPGGRDDRRSPRDRLSTDHP